MSALCWHRNMGAWHAPRTPCRTTCGRPRETAASAAPSDCHAPTNTTFLGESKRGPGHRHCGMSDPILLSNTVRWARPGMGFHGPEPSCAQQRLRGTPAGGCPHSLSLYSSYSSPPFGYAPLVVPTRPGGGGGGRCRPQGGRGALRTSQ